ncbi:MAG: protoporphyrinogen oxidase [Caldilineaceae bacterium]|nr:protoporphyrinogen oxidase [Caldilineaceae bacterium]
MKNWALPPGWWGGTSAIKKTFVLRQGQLHRLPEGLTGMIPTNLDALANSTLLSDGAKQRVAMEASLPPLEGDEDESIASFVTRRMGQEVYEQLVEPLMSGIYGGDGTQLSLAATFPQLRQLERDHGSLIVGLLNSQKQTASVPTYPPFVSFPSGMGELVAALTDQLRDVEICLGSRATQITRSAAGPGYSVALEKQSQTELHADVLIITTPAFVTAKLLGSIDPELAEAHAAIPYGSSATISLAYAADTISALDGYGYVIPSVEGTDVLACTWTSSKWRGRRPKHAR